MKRLLTFLLLTLAWIAVAQPGTLQAQGWVQVNTSVNWDFDKLYVQNKDTIYVTSYGILRTTDGGATWDSLAGLPKEASEFGFKMIQFVDDTTAYLLPRAIGPNNVLFKSTNAGLTWTPHETGMQGSVTVGVVFPTHDSGNVADPGDVSRTTDGGETWEVHGVGVQTNAMAFADRNHGYVIGDVLSWLEHPGWSAPSFARTTNGGASWKDVFTGPNPDYPGHTGLFRTVWDIAAISAAKLISVGSRGSIGISIDSGDSWDTIISGTTYEVLNAVDFPDSLNGTIVGSHGWISHSTDGGATWTRQNSGVSLYLSSVRFVDALLGYISGASGTILKTVNGGQSWVNISPGQTQSLAVSVYPQPSSTQARLTYDLPTTQYVTVNLYDSKGTRVISIPGRSPAFGKQELTIDVTPLPAGTYIYEVLGDCDYGTGKLTVTKLF